MTTWLVLCAVLAAVLVLRRMLTVATVRGLSMAPTLADGDRVLALRCIRYKAGDVIIFRSATRCAVPGDPTWRVKRVAAVAGDPVPLWLTGHGCTVPPRALVVIGDNARSQDSRQLGYIPRRAVAGRVLRRIQATDLARRPP